MPTIPVTKLQQVQQHLDRKYQVERLTAERTDADAKLEHYQRCVVQQQEECRQLAFQLKQAQDALREGGYRT